MDNDLETMTKEELIAEAVAEGEEDFSAEMLGEEA